MPRNYLWDLLQMYMDSPLHDYPPKPADIARKTGVSEQVLSKWKKKATLPTPAQLSALARGTGLPFSRLLEAALQGKDYLPPELGLRLVDIAVDGTEQELARATLRRRMETVEIAVRRLGWTDEESRVVSERMRARLFDFFSGQAADLGAVVDITEDQLTAALNELRRLSDENDGVSPPGAIEQAARVGLAKEGHDVLDDRTRAELEEHLRKEGQEAVERQKTTGLSAPAEAPDERGAAG